MSKYLPFAPVFEDKDRKYGIVQFIGSDVVSVYVQGTGVIKNVIVMPPLRMEDISYGDRVVIYWMDSAWHCTGIIRYPRYYTKQRREAFSQAAGPPSPQNLVVTIDAITHTIPILRWEYGGNARERLDHDMYEVDAREVGGDWGISPYPVKTSSTQHESLLPQKMLEVRVRALDRFGNRSSWSYAQKVFADTLAPPAPIFYNTYVASEDGQNMRINVSKDNMPGDFMAFMIASSSDASGTGAWDYIYEGDATSLYLPIPEEEDGTRRYYNILARDYLGNVSEPAIDTRWLVVPKTFINKDDPGDSTDYLEIIRDGKLEHWTTFSNSLAEVTISSSTVKTKGYSVKAAMKTGTYTASRTDILRFDWPIPVTKGQLFIGENIYFWLHPGTDNENFDLRLFVDQYKTAQGHPCQVPTKSYALSYGDSSWTSQGVLFEPDEDCYWFRVSVGFAACSIELDFNLHIDQFSHWAQEISYEGDPCTIHQDVLVSGGMHIGSLGDFYDNDLIVDGGLVVGRSADPSQGTIDYTGDLKPYRSSTQYTGYLPVPCNVQVYSSQSNLANGTTIDLSAAGLPAGIKGVFCYLEYTPTTYNAGDYGALARESGYYTAMVATPPGSSTPGRASGFVPCDSNGDIYFLTSDATNTVTLNVTGYLI